MSDKKTVPVAAEQELFTLDQAFSYGLDLIGSTEFLDVADTWTRSRAQELREDLFDFERVNRAVAFLIDLTTEAGNKPLDGNAGAGLARILEANAERIARQRNRIGKGFV